MSTELIVADHRAEFAQVFNRLAVALQAHNIDAVTLEEYHRTLGDLPLRWLAAGAERLKRQSNRTFFPNAAEWRDAAVAERRETERRELAREHRTEPWRFECEHCQDTGFLFDLKCGGKGECGMASCLRMSRRGNGYGPHTYATPCPCRPNNRTYQRSVQAGMTGRRAKDQG